MRALRFLYCFNDRAHFRRFLLGLIILAGFAGLGLAVVPFANAATFSCTGAVPTGNMFNYDTISNKLYDQNRTAQTLSSPTASTINDDPYTTGACVASLGIIGRTICFFKTTIGQVLSTMYCDFQSKLIGPISLALTLFVAISGIMIVSGMTRLTVREGIKAALKVALVYTFATNATWGIGIGYAFFMGLAEQGSALLINAAGAPGSGGGTALTLPDSIIGSVIGISSRGSGTGMPVAFPGSLQSVCMLWLFTLMLLLIVFLPMVAIFLSTMMIQYLWLYIRALLGYLTALVLIAFLFILAPMFICFALFQATRFLFDQWLKYLTSFSLQMVIVFGFLAILQMVPLGDFFKEMLSLLRQTDTTMGGTNVAIPGNFCSVCPYTINRSAPISGPGSPPITCLDGGVTPLAAGIPLSQLVTSQDLVETIVAQVVALWIVGNVMQDFLKNAPRFAGELAGRVPFAAILGGTADSASIGGGSIEYPGLDTAEGYTMDAPRRWMGDSSARSTLVRTAFGVGLLANSGLLGSFMNKKNSEQDEAKQAAARGTTLARAGSSGIMQGARTGAASGASGSAARDNTPTSMRTALAMQPLLLNALNTQDRYEKASTTLEDSYDDVQSALQTVEQFRASNVADPLAQREALRVLKQANDAYLVAWTNLDTSQQAILTDKQNLGATLSSPQDKGSKLAALVGSGGKRTAADAGPLAAMSPAEMRDYVDRTVQHLQTEVEVQSYLLPEDRVSYARAGLDDAVKALDTTATTDGKGLTAVLRQLYVVEKSLTGGGQPLAAYAATAPESGAQGAAAGAQDKTYQTTAALRGEQGRDNRAGQGASYAQDKTFDAGAALRGEQGRDDRAGQGATYAQDRPADFTVALQGGPLQQPGLGATSAKLAGADFTASLRADKPPEQNQGSGAKDRPADFTVALQGGPLPEAGLGATSAKLTGADFTASLRADKPAEQNTGSGAQDRPFDMHAELTRNDQPVGPVTPLVQDKGFDMAASLRGEKEKDEGHGATHGQDRPFDMMAELKKGNDDDKDA